MKSFPFIIISLFCTIVLSAQSPSYTEIENVANSFLIKQSKKNIANLKSASIQKIDTIKHINVGDQTLFNVAEISPKGFIVLSNNKSFTPIVAYSYNSEFNYNTDSTNLLYNLLKIDLSQREQASTENIDNWSANKTTKSESRFEQWPEEGTTSTGGWIETTWDQHDPYNNQCPTLSNGNKAVAGCVPIAIAQLLNFHGDIGEESLTTINIYKSNNVNIDIDSLKNKFPSFNTVNNQLNIIKNKYRNNINLNENDISYLVFAAGITSKAQYDNYNTSSFASDYFKSLRDFWGYDNIKSLVFDIVDDGYSFNPDDKIDNNKHYSLFHTIENIIDGYPCLLSFQNHIAILDGYNSNGYFHINYGWGENSPNNISETWYQFPNFPIYNYGLNIISDIIPSSHKNIFSAERILLKNKNDIENFTIKLQNENISITASEDFLISIDKTNFTRKVENINIPDSINIYVKFIGDSIKSGGLSLNFDHFPNKHIELIGIEKENQIINNENKLDTFKNINLPYFIDEVLLYTGEPLFIEPGVKIVFSKNGGINIKSSNIVANGQVNDRINFSSLNRHRGCKGFNISYHSQSKNELSFCDFISCNLKIYYNDFIISNCSFINNSNAISLTTNKSDSYLINCLISNNNEGIHIYGQNYYGKINIEYCSILNNKIGITGNNVNSLYKNCVICNNSIIYKNDSFEGDTINCYIKRKMALKTQDPVIGIDYNKTTYDLSPINYSNLKNQGEDCTYLTKFDILGNSRVYGLFPDIGAFEDNRKGKSIRTSPHSEYDFTEVMVGTIKEKKIFIYNPDYDTLKISSINIVDTSDCFHFSKQMNLNEIIIPPLEKDSINIFFEPKEMNFYKSELIIRSNASISKYILPLIGKGYIDGTIIKGKISGTWDTLGAPYIIIDKCIIDENKSLLIEEGVEVIFFCNKPIIVNGGLSILGSEKNNVKFEHKNIIPSTVFTTTREPQSKSWVESFTPILLKYTTFENFNNILSLRNSKIDIHHCIFKHNKNILSTRECFHNISNNIITNNLNNYPFQLSRSWQVDFSYNRLIDNKSSLISYNSIGENSKLNIKNNKFIKNGYSARTEKYMFNLQGGGEMFIDNNIISNNSYPYGIFFISSSCLYIRNNCIVNNESVEFCPNSSFIRFDKCYFINNTICNNIAENILSNTKLSTSNNIFKDNYKKNGTFSDILLVNGSENANYNGFYNSHEIGSNNIVNVNPKFVSPCEKVGNYINDSIFDWSLKPNSNYIDNGTNIVIDFEFDLNQNKRIFDGNSNVDEIVDLGCYEYASTESRTKFAEKVNICSGLEYNGWYNTGHYKKNYLRRNQSDSLVSTILTVNPNYKVSEDISICEGESYNGWEQTGIYNRTLSSISGCDSTITTNLNVNPTYQTSEEITICEGESYNNWSASGLYRKDLKSVCGCDSIVKVYLNVDKFSTKPFITQDIDTLYSNYENGNQWYYNDEIIEDEIEQKLVINQSGDYYTIVTNENGCVSEPSNTISTNLSSISEVTNSLFKVYPNPATNKLTIELQDALPPYIIELFNIAGQKVIEQKSSHIKSQVNIKNIESGIYSIKVTSNKQSLSEKVIVEK